MALEYDIPVTYYKHSRLFLLVLQEKQQNFCFICRMFTNIFIQLFSFVYLRKLLSLITCHSSYFSNLD